MSFFCARGLRLGTAQVGCGVDGSRICFSSTRESILWQKPPSNCKRTNREIAVWVCSIGYASPNVNHIYFHHLPNDALAAISFDTTVYREMSRDRLKNSRGGVPLLKLHAGALLCVRAIMVPRLACGRICEAAGDACARALQYGPVAWRAEQESRGIRKANRAECRHHTLQLYDRTIAVAP